MDIDNAQGILKLRKPLLLDDQEVTEIKYDFDELPPTAIKNVMKEIGKIGHVIAFTGNDLLYNLFMFAQASNIHFHDIQRLSVFDQNRAATLTMGFFNSGLEEE